MSTPSQLLARQQAILKSTSLLEQRLNKLAAGLSLEDNKKSDKSNTPAVHQSKENKENQVKKEKGPKPSSNSSASSAAVTSSFVFPVTPSSLDALVPLSASASSFPMEAIAEQKSLGGVVPTLVETCLARGLNKFQFIRVYDCIEAGKYPSNINKSGEDIHHLKHKLSQEDVPGEVEPTPPSSYYQWLLSSRCVSLFAPSTRHLCKSIILENSRYAELITELPYYNEEKMTADENTAVGRVRKEAIHPRYICVITSYAQSYKLHKEKLNKTIHTLHTTLRDRYLKENSDTEGLLPPFISKKLMNYRLCPEEVSTKLTGAEHNAVTPVSLLPYSPFVTSNHEEIKNAPIIPIIFPANLLDVETSSIFLGGGEVDVKLRVDIREFISNFNAVIADITAASKDKE